MKTLFKIVFIFLALTGAATLLMNHSDIRLGNTNFWDEHGIFFLIFITLFPRLTLLFSTVPFGGFFWWLGFIFTPRILVAILATIAYWQQNPILVLISWLVALGGESGEKFYISSKTNVYRPKKSLSSDDVLEAEFKRKN
jgi:hypothetical protein